MTAPSADRDLFERLERFYDAVARSGADAQDHGPFTLFVSRGPWTYYARPRFGFDGAFTADDVATSALIEDAVEAGIGTIFLSAASDDTARIYKGLGFEQVGHAGLAEPPSPPPSS